MIRLFCAFVGFWCWWTTLWRNVYIILHHFFTGILEREQEQSVVYGSIDFGKTIVTNEKYKELVGKLMYFGGLFYYTSLTRHWGFTRFSWFLSFCCLLRELVCLSTDTRKHLCAITLSCINQQWWYFIHPYLISLSEIPGQMSLIFHLSL